MIKRWIAVTLVALVPIQAQAAPVFTALGAWAFSFGGIGAVAYISAVGTITSALIVNFAIGKISNALFGKGAPSQTPSTQTIMVRSTKAPCQIVYGEVRTSGALAFLV